jgi:hypothetical protein
LASARSAVVESMVNRVIGRRMAKKQPMRWNRRGAHLLVQIRVAVLSGGRLEQVFQQWYPRFEPPGPADSPCPLKPPRGFFHFQTFWHLIGQPEGKAPRLLNDLRFLATFGDPSLSQGLTRSNHEGEKTLHPPKMTEGYRRLTKSGQEP